MRIRYWKRRWGAYLTKHVKRRPSWLSLYITEQNPLPTKDIQFALRCIDRSLFRVNVCFATIAQNGYLMEFHINMEEQSSSISASRIYDYRQYWINSDINHSDFLASLEKLICATPAVENSSLRDEIRAYKQRHREIDFDELKIKIHNFRRMFPVVHNDSTPPPVLAYLFTEKLDYDRVGHFYSNYQHYYDKLKEFYGTPTTISNYALRAKKISLVFDLNRVGNDCAFDKGVLREEYFSQPSVYFATHVTIQFEFCEPPPSAWDAEDANLDDL